MLLADGHIIKQEPAQTTNINLTLVESTDIVIFDRNDAKFGCSIEGINDQHSYSYKCEYY